MYTFLDYFFIVLHGSLVLFILTGWARKRTRRIHLMVSGLMISSWFGLGIFYGWGYCPFTDWHWKVKRELGEMNLPNSYVNYYVNQLTGSTWDPFLVDTAVVTLGLLAFAVSCWLNWKDGKLRRYLRHNASSLKWLWMIHGCLKGRFWTRVISHDQSD